jgi:hypothetical protein
MRHAEVRQTRGITCCNCGVLDRDLRQAVLGALALDPAPCVAYAHSRSWRAATDTFLSLLAPLGEPAGATI